MVIAFLLAAAAPSAEAERLGRELANHGTLAALLPLKKAQEVEELLAAHRDLTASEQAQLRKTADRVFEKGRDRVLTATGHAYAKALSVKDLRKIVFFYRTPVARRFQKSLPAVIGGTVAGLDSMDFKGDVAAAYCKETGKLCGK